MNTTRSRPLWAAWVLLAACGGQAKPVPRVPPSTIAAVADDGERGADAAAEGGGPARHRDTPPRRDGCGVVVVVSMEGLMLPGGVALLQERLVQRHLLAPPYREDELDAPTLAAILELQRRSELPAVGLPSYQTVRAIGMDPARVFAAGSARCGGAS